MNNAFTNYKLPENKRAPAYYWQEKALEAISYLENPVKSQVFKWYKLKEAKVEACLRYMKSRNIKNFYYLCKIMAIK